MDQTAVLKVVNPVLAILMLDLPISSLLCALTGWGFFKGLHVDGVSCSWEQLSILSR
jgi:hypothetical protein